MFEQLTRVEPRRNYMERALLRDVLVRGAQLRPLSQSSGMVHLADKPHSMRQVRVMLLGKPPR